MAEKTSKRNGDIFFQLTKRHLLVFFKNKVRVMYTLLVPVIIFAVYLFFLRSMELTTVENELLKLGVVKDETLTHYIETLVDSWMLSGITALSTITVSLQTNSVFVEDKQNGVNRDFASSPIHKNLLIGSYFFYNFIVTSLICGLFLLVCLVYLACMGEFVITFGNFMMVLLVMFVSTVSSTLMTVFLCSFLKTEGTLASLIAVFSTAIGFLIGAYMPLAMLPGWVQNFCAFIPGTYACSLLRYSFMDTPLKALQGYVLNSLQLENGEALLTQLTGSFGYNLNFFNTTVGPQYQSLALSVFIVVFLLLNIGFGQKLVSVLGVDKTMKKLKRKKQK